MYYEDQEIEGRKFIPGPYRHFKGGFYYAVGVCRSGEDVDMTDETAYDKLYEMIKAKHTETGDMVPVIVLEDGSLYSDRDEDLVLYKSLKDGVHYLRPVEMFMSKTDRNKYSAEMYPQEYRLERL
jgi:hypothetical protein